MKDIFEIRRKEQYAHETMYTQGKLYQSDNWLGKPVKTVTALLPELMHFSSVRVLDLGCGIGRNAIEIAKQLNELDCTIDCVDILDTAIDMLNQNAAQYGVADAINGFRSPIEDFQILQGHYHFVLAVSALEHINNLSSFFRVLTELEKAVKPGGIVCFIINTNISECRKDTQEFIEPQFEINMPSGQMIQILKNCFSAWTLIQVSVKTLRFEIPREEYTSMLTSDVVTFTARKRAE